METVNFEDSRCKKSSECSGEGSADNVETEPEGEFRVAVEAREVESDTREDTYVKTKSVRIFFEGGIKGRTDQAQLTSFSKPEHYIRGNFDLLVGRPDRRKRAKNHRKRRKGSRLIFVAEDDSALCGLERGRDKTYRIAQLFQPQMTERTS